MWLLPELPFPGTQGREAGISLQELFRKSFLAEIIISLEVKFETEQQIVVIIIKCFIKHRIALLDILSYDHMGFKAVPTTLIFICSSLSQELLFAI